jgi:signal transduction histidine kinase
MDEGMGKREQTVLIVSDDATLCAEARREFAVSIPNLRVTTVSTVDAARRILEQDSPALILFEAESIAAAAVGGREELQRMDSLVTALSVYAPVVVLDEETHRPELADLIAAGAVDYVHRDSNWMRSTLERIQQRLREIPALAETPIDPFAEPLEDFGEILRHELNNPLTGILGNAELLLAEIRRTRDGQLPHGGQQRLETIATLAVRLRETVRRLSQEWEARQHTVQ